MSAIEYRRYQLVCDGPHQHGAFFRAPATTTRCTPRARVRVLAARAGWTHVRSDSGRRFDTDYCPAHKADAEEAMAQRTRRNALREAL